MEKRTLIAVVLSLAVLIIWQVFFVKPPEKPAVTAVPAVNAPAAGQVPAEAEIKPELPPPPAEEPIVEQIINVETPLYSAEFSSRGGTIRKWTLKDFRDSDGSGVSLLREGAPYDALAVGWNDDFSVSRKNFAAAAGDLRLSESNPTGTLVFTLSTPQYSIRRTYTFRYDAYTVNIRDEVSGVPDYEITLGGDFGIHKKKDRYTHVGPVLLKGTDLEEIKDKKLKNGPIAFAGQDVKWIALEDKYFCSALIPAEPMAEAKSWKYMDSSAIALKAAAGVHELTLYAGPKRQEDLKVAGGGLEHIVDFGFFSVIARPIFWLLKEFYNIVGNYGWAIVILTIVIRIPFIPIVNKGQRSMKRLQKVQPLMQQIREQYKNDPKRMQSEMMALYKKHKVNPMGGCLPMLLQIPVFFALYKVLLVSIELRSAPWVLWIQDLSAKDPLYILPIVMGISMVVQQKMTPSPGDPKQQKLMMFMPVIFTFLFLNFASGLVLYWLVNNLLSIGQQIFVNKKKD